MLLNSAYDNFKQNPGSEAYEILGDALLRYVQLETKRLFRGRCNAEEREDIGSEALIRILSNLGKFGGTSSFATWVTSIVQNEGERLFGKLGRQLAVISQGLAGNESYDPGPSLNDKIVLKQLIARLDGEDRRFVQLNLAGLDYEEIALELGITEDAAKKRWERIQLKLRTHAGGV